MSETQTGMRSYFPCGPLTVFRRRAMASDFEASFNDVADPTRDEAIASAALDALDEVDRVEEALSVFRPTSAVSRINLLASEMNARVDEELWSWLELSLRLGAETRGAFDVASAPLWRAWGFAKREGEFPEESARRRALELSGVRHLRMNEDSLSIAFDEEGVELNFGAIGKGIALDCAASLLESRGIADFLIQGGRSGVVARGGRANDFPYGSFPDEKAVASGGSDRSSSDDEEDDDESPYSESGEIDEESGLRRRSRGGSREDGRSAMAAFLPGVFSDGGEPEVPEQPDAPIGWTIGLAHPLNPEQRLGEIWLKDRALATSGSTWQFFRSGGKRYSHIIDPRTGMPTTGVLSTTVLAPTGAVADALSTAFFVLGYEESRELFGSRPEIGALFILERETSPGYEIRTFNMPPGVLRVF